MITELTQTNKDRLIDYGLKWTRIGLSTDEVDMTLAMDAIKKAYKYAGLKSGPKVFLGPFNNPVECAQAQIVFKRLPANTNISDLRSLTFQKGEIFTAEELYEAIDEQVYGFQEAHWLGYYEFLKNEFNIVELGALDGLNDVAETVGWWAPYDKVAFIQNRPLEIHLDENGLLHAEDKPALKWRGEARDYDIWAIHGELLPPKQ